MELLGINFHNIIYYFLRIVKFKMKILAIICEFNPFHNGHKYLLERAKELSGCDAVLCIMSGGFTQRGDMCIMDKYTRAKHAVSGGADCVIQLPAPFAVAPAEIFAKGAIKILLSIPEVTALAFGCESGDEYEFFKAAELFIDESDKFKTVINKKLAEGESYIKSYAEAFEACGGNRDIVANPNNVLGFEYCKAILRVGADIDILPVKRVGAGYNDGELKENYSSASAIRNNLTDIRISDNIPPYVYNDLKYSADLRSFHAFLRHSLFVARPEDMQKIFGCGEGLENKLKSLENTSIENIVEKCTSKRYSSSRIKRILCANALGLYADDAQKFLGADLYIKPLAVKKTRANEILSALSKSAYPVITDANGKGLSAEAERCFCKDGYEFAVYNHINRTDKKDYMILV